MDDIFLLFILFIISKIMFQVFFHIFHLLKFHHSGTHFLYQFRTVADYDHTNSSSLGFFHKEMPDLALSNEIEHCTDLICQKKSFSFYNSFYLIDISSLFLFRGFVFRFFFSQ